MRNYFCRVSARNCSKDPLNTFKSTSSLIPGTLPTSVCCRSAMDLIFDGVYVIVGNPVG